MYHWARWDFACRCTTLHSDLAWFPHVEQDWNPARLGGHILNLQSFYYFSFVEMEDQVGPLTVPKRRIGKHLKFGERQMILHCFNTLCGCELDYVDGGFFVFGSKSTHDYHEEMTCEVFLTWFRSILPDSSSSDEEQMKKFLCRASNICSVPNRSMCIITKCVSWLQ
jgi:hypothetical protein